MSRITIAQLKKAFGKAADFGLMSPRVVALELQQQLCDCYDVDVELGLAWSCPTLSFQLSNDKRELEDYLLTVVNDIDTSSIERVDYVEIQLDGDHSKARRMYSIKQVLEWLNLQQHARNAEVKIPQPTSDIR